MYTEKLKFRDKKTRGLTISPNPHAADLENTLGINFPVLPHAIEATSKNINVLKVHLGVPPYGIHSMMVLGAIYTSDWAGLYMPTIISYLYKTPDNLTARHENMHGYIDLINPHIDKFLTGCALACAIYVAGVRETLPDIEKFTAFKCLDEGLAYWASVKSGIALGGDDASAAYSLTRDLDNVDYGGNKNKVSKSLQLLKGNLDETIFRNHLERENFYKIKNGKQNVMGQEIPLGAVMRSTNVVGFNFVGRCMDQLECLGFSTNHAIDLLITKPPKTLTELADPESFIQKVYRTSTT